MPAVTLHLQSHLVLFPSSHLGVGVARAKDNVIPLCLESESCLPLSLGKKMEPSTVPLAGNIFITVAPDK